MTIRTNQTLRNQALALAGVTQFSLYAQELTADGVDRPQRIDAAKRAIFCTDPDTVMDVFGDLSNIGDGIAYLRSHLGGERPDAKAALIGRYIGQVLRLSGRVLDDRPSLNRIRGAIDRARLADEAEVLSILNDAYRVSISPLKPKIMLQGHPSYLKNDEIQAKARTHLMAAVRCAILWRQCGGGFLSLFFRRKALLRALQESGPTNIVR